MKEVLMGVGRMRAKRFVRLGLVAGLFLGACSVIERDRVAVDSEPPKPLFESAPQKPGAQEVWVAGYWDWNEAQAVWRWVPGAWLVPPRPGARWVEPRHERQGDTWVLIKGRWQ
jgi:hypothetical protein